MVWRCCDLELSIRNRECRRVGDNRQASCRTIARREMQSLPRRLAGSLPLSVSGSETRLSPPPREHIVWKFITSLLRDRSTFLHLQAGDSMPLRSTPRPETSGALSPGECSPSTAGPQGMIHRNGFLSTMVSVRLGPTERRHTSTPASASTRRTYRRVADGRSSCVAHAAEIRVPAIQLLIDRLGDRQFVSLDRHLVALLPPYRVAHAHLDLTKAPEDINLGQRQASEAIEPHRTPQGRQV